MSDWLLAGALALTGLSLLACERRRVQFIRRGFRQQHAAHRAALQRRGAVLIEFSTWASRGHRVPGTALQHAASHQAQAEHACANLERHPTDAAALAAMEASGATLGGSSQGLMELLSSTQPDAVSHPTQAPHAHDDSSDDQRGSDLLHELTCLDKSLQTQTQTTCSMARLLDREGRRPLARLAGFTAQLGLLPDSHREIHG